MVGLSTNFFRLHSIGGKATLLKIAARGHLLPVSCRQSGGDAEEVSRHHPDDEAADQRPTV